MKSNENITQSIDNIINKTKQSSGEGIVTNYTLFDGVHLCLMDLTVTSIDYSNFSMELAKDIICINHCNQGLFEGVFPNGEWVHLSEGDCSINLPEHSPIAHNFPLGNYQGVLIILEFDKAKKSLISELGENVPIDLDIIRGCISEVNSFFVFQKEKELQNIFSCLYNQNNCVFYFKLKIIELLYFLSKQRSPQHTPKRYFEKQQRYKVNQIKEFLINNLEIRYTIPQLCEQFDISATSLKICFKEVYGVPISEYMRNYRIIYAQKRIAETELSIADIAHEVGYENQSKFTETFKKSTNMTPIEYRNKNKY